jgi:septal ring-binding cell division protein DamX
MINKVQFLTLCLCATGLTACATDGTNYHSFQSYYASYSYQPYRYQDTQYSKAFDNLESYSSEPQSTAIIPDSYHTGPLHSPTSHKDVDRNWVNTQNPSGYTIQIGESEKASQVAAKLYKAPKSDRAAEIKYNRDGRDYYKGVYGSYSNYEEAQKVLNNLPPEIKEGADIKTWSSVQENSQ